MVEDDVAHGLRSLAPRGWHLTALPPSYAERSLQDSPLFARVRRSNGSRTPGQYHPALAAEVEVDRNPELRAKRVVPGWGEHGRGSVGSGRHERHHPPPLLESPYAEEDPAHLGFSVSRWHSVIIPMIMPKPDLRRSRRLRKDPVCSWGHIYLTPPDQPHDRAPPARADPLPRGSAALS